MLLCILVGNFLESQMLVLSPYFLASAWMSFRELFGINDKIDLLLPRNSYRQKGQKNS